mmetsp:Transcript_6821/g.10117  ORF Transcript_6821/g.10117 Transcript_6821/m.10117 type:complete len:91 (+) Transcript_6821:419-691(+)
MIYDACALSHAFLTSHLGIFVQTRTKHMYLNNYFSDLRIFTMSALSCIIFSFNNEDAYCDLLFLTTKDNGSSQKNSSEFALRVLLKYNNK